jgi:hypothetical protein
VAGNPGRGRAGGGTAKGCARAPGHRGSAFPGARAARALTGAEEAAGAALRARQAGGQHGARSRVGEGTREAAAELLSGLLLPPCAPIIALRAPGASQVPGHLPPHSSLGPSPGPRNVRLWAAAGFQAEPKGRIHPPRADRRDERLLSPCPGLSWEQEAPLQRPSTNGLRAATALPARRPLKKTREEETREERVRPPGSRRAELITAGGRGAGPRAPGFERHLPATSAHCAPPPHPRTGLQPEGVSPRPAA